MKQHIYTADEALFLAPELLGGKAANLAWMTREAIPVPRWRISAAIGSNADKSSLV